MAMVKLFLSVFFISLGVFYLLELSPFYYHPYSFNLKLFPLVFVLIGFLLIKPKKWATTIIVILLAILISSSVYSWHKKYFYNGGRIHFFFERYENFDDNF